MGVERHDELLEAVVVDFSLATARQLPEDESLRLRQVAEQHARTADGVFVDPDDRSADAVMAALGLYNGVVLMQYLMAEHTATMEEEEEAAKDKKKKKPDAEEE